MASKKKKEVAGACGEDKPERAGPLLKHLLFPQRPLQPIDPNNGGPVSLEAVLWNHYYRYYRLAIQDALHRSRRKPFQLGGLAGYDQLVGLLSHLEKRRQHYGSDAYLSALETRLRSAVEVAQSQAEQVRQAQRFLQQVEHYLAHTPRPTLPAQEKEARPNGQGANLELANQPQPVTRAQVQQQLEHMFNQFAQQSNVGRTGQRLYRKWQRASQTWLPGILHCYQIAGLPRSNLELEAVYGQLRENQRRVSGRKETSPLRLFGAGEALALIIETEQELLAWCQTVAEDQDTYRTQRRLQEESEEQRQRWRYRLHRDPDKAMTRVDAQFYAILKERELMSVLKQTDT
ncbi:MAG: hypothetical protein ACYSW0_23050 [Planctomycetota bacterium]